MKKVIFGSALMLSGIIASMGLLTVEAVYLAGGRHNHFAEFAALFFFIVSIIGMVVAITGLKSDK